MSPYIITDVYPFDRRCAISIEVGISLDKEKGAKRTGSCTYTASWDWDPLRKLRGKSVLLTRLGRTLTVKYYLAYLLVIRNHDRHDFFLGW